MESIQVSSNSQYHAKKTAKMSQDSPVYADFFNGNIGMKKTVTVFPY